MLSHGKLLKSSAILLLASFLLIFIIPLIFNAIVRNQASLKKGHFIRKLYLKMPMSLDFSVYLFNVTNPEAVNEGAVPILNQMGPYVYDLYKERINIEENTEEDSLTYTPFDQYFFNQEKSGELTQDDIVTVIHPIIVGMVNIVQRDTPQYLQIVNGAIPILFNKPSDIFITAKVRDILFNGMEINCNTKQFGATAVCSQLKISVPGLVELREKVYGLSVFGTKNGSLPMRITVNRGIQNSRDLGRLLAVNNQTDAQIWQSEECNAFYGTDGWIFPALSNHDDQLFIHSTDFCRNIHADVVKSTHLHGVPVKKYYADYGDMTQPEEKCYCPTPETCLPKGILDVSQCVKTPIYVSLPHFLRADPKLLKEVQGLNPITEEHITRILFEGILAIPLEAQIRAQLNFPLSPVEKISLMKKVPNVIFPFMWIELGVKLKGGLLRMVQALFIGIMFLKVVKYSLLVGSVLGVIYSLFHIYQSKQTGVKITVVNNGNA